ncbi:hypothetical protein PFICI_13919 [Pestalotiopsis fici W106-1]|uniref:Uncharacterized protein n=1 Tax=Pestalotiopsis fici (strain W106-1 / CGMCC3.15140) TaxID=1229662 RepID=W3WJK0_PESFW|nr:uncharacterized protein PFICI_13919 [Pestalotiopsis fici W106-1]ETS74053.1 hypothetical protein PFICI_13919 [Pestalotiopsis fici W106-1]
MVCQCVKKRVTYSCLHQESKLEKCWRDNWRHEFPCLEVLVPRCDSPVQSKRKKRFGFCPKCAAHFGLPERPSRYDKKYVERYLDYKKDMRLAEERIKATDIPLSAVFGKAHVEREPGGQQSPMRVRRSSNPTQASNKTRTVNTTGRHVSSEDSPHTRFLVSRAAPKVLSAFSLHDGESEDESDGEAHESDAEVYELEYMSTSQNSTPQNRARTSTNYPSYSMDVTDAARASTLLSLCHDSDSDSDVVTTEFDIELDEFESVVIHRAVPKLEMPSRPRGKGRKFYQSGLRSVQSPSGFATRVKTARSHSLSIPCPPPPVVGRVFTGRCREHQGVPPPLTPRDGGCCSTCERGGVYLEAGIPTVEDELRRNARSAPPILIRCQVPASRFECAVQTCFCDLVSDDKCLTCREREKQAEILGAAFF